jgi:hypothetical protein
MPSLKRRLDRLENELHFVSWFRFLRWLENLPTEQLEELTSGHFVVPDRLPDPPLGSSRLDRLDRKTLMKLWEEDEHSWANRSGEEKEFFIAHAHWPEQACGADCRYAN